MEILNKEEVLKKNDGYNVSGFVYIQSYTENPTKNGGSYLGGVLQAMGDVQFKVWGGTVAFNKMIMQDIQGKICGVNATVNEFGGAKSLILDDISLVESDEADKLGLDINMFYKHKYDLNAYWNKLVKILQTNISEQAMYIFNLLMESKYDDKHTVKERFLTEYAAISYHDNCVGGLIAHTTKLENMAKFMKMYPAIIQRVDLDTLYLGIALHDIGKVFEYSNGSISDIGRRVSHNTYGCLLVSQYKEEIEGVKGEDFYWTLISIIAQHHGEYGERPRTIAAYIINQIDCFDSTMTLLNQILEESKDNQISFDGYKLI